MREVSCFAMSADGAHLAVGDGPELLVYLATGQPVWKHFCDGILIDANTIPAQLKQATAELAVWLINNDAAGTGGESSNLPEGIKRVKADVVEVEFFEDGSADSKTGSDLLPVNTRFLLRCFGKPTVGRVRYVNAVR